MPNTIEYYLSKGFDRPMAEYFAGGRKKLVQAVPQRDFTLLLTYDGGEKRGSVHPVKSTYWNDIAGNERIRTYFRRKDIGNRGGDS